jgi:hypothetical protein
MSLDATNSACKLVFCVLNILSLFLQTEFLFKNKKSMQRHSSGNYKQRHLLQRTCHAVLQPSSRQHHREIEHQLCGQLVLVKQLGPFGSVHQRPILLRTSTLFTIFFLFIESTICNLINAIHDRQSTTVDFTPLAVMRPMRKLTIIKCCFDCLQN